MVMVQVFTSSFLTVQAASCLSAGSAEVPSAQQVPVRAKTPPSAKAVQRPLMKTLLSDAWRKQKASLNLSEHDLQSVFNWTTGPLPSQKARQVLLGPGADTAPENELAPLFLDLEAIGGQVGVGSDRALGAHPARRRGLSADLDVVRRPRHTRNGPGCFQGDVALGLSGHVPAEPDLAPENAHRDI